MIDSTKPNRYLVKEAYAYIDASYQERIDFIREERWITYTVANEVLHKMDLLLSHPKKNRMPGMLIVGETNNGKSSIVQKFLSNHKPFRGEAWQETTEIPVIAVLAPPKPNLSELYSSILEQFSIPFKNGDKVAKKEQLIKYYFGLCKLKVLIIDEIHNILSGPRGQQIVFMNALKNLSTSLEISIIVVGIKEALRATNTDTQISNRFKPVFLPKWEISDEYLSLLASIEKTLPLRKPSEIATNIKMAETILEMSDGYIGEIVDLIVAAAIYAIESGSERISMKELVSCDFVRPTHRKDFEDLISL